MVFVELIHNVALILALSITYNFISRKWNRQEMIAQVMTGFLFGGVAVIGMMDPMNFAPGVIFDGRSILISMAGLFGGLIPASLAALLGSFYRLWAGGTGALTGIGVICTSAAIGVLFHYKRRRNPEIMTSSYLFSFGLLVHIFMLLWMLTLPWPLSIEVLKKISAPVIMIFPLATILLGKLLDDQESRNRAEEALRESEEKYRNLIELTSEGCWQIDPSLTTIEVNQALCDILGYNREEMIGKTPFDFVDDENRKIFVAQTSKISDTDHRSYEIILRKQTGEEVHAHFNATTIRDKSGAVQGSFALVADITTRKRTEKNLRRFEAIISTVSDPMSYIDNNYIYKTVNDAYTRVFNKSREAIVGRSVAVLLGQDAFDDQIKGYLDKSLSGEEVQYQDWFDFPDGKRRYMDMTYYPYVEKGRGISGTVVAARDKTELELARLDLKRINSELNQIFNSSIPLCIIDRDYTLRRSNKTFCKLFEVEAETIHRKKCYDVLRTSLCDTPKCPMKQIDSGNLVIEQETKIALNAGCATSCLVTANPLEGGEGEFLGIVECFMDVTQLNSTKKEREKLEAQLQQAQKLDSIGILAGGIAHDFNNLLSIILGNIDLAKDDLNPEAGASGFLNEAEKAAQRAGELSNQLITFSKGGAPVKKTGSIEDLVKEITDFSLSDSEVKCEFIISSDLYAVKCDQSQMKHAIKNIIINAVESIPDSGSIIVKAENFNITTERDLPFPEGKYVKISIRDQGIGIPEEHLSKIFDPYFSTKAMGVQKGMGLGLATTYSIISKHDGHITVESEVDVGTTFTIYLPVAVEDIVDTEPAKMVEPKKPAVRTGRILVMDDEEIFRSLSAHVLNRLDYEPETAKDGAEAIELYKRAMDSGKPFDTVILDLTIKGGAGGKEVIKQLMKIDPDIKAIVSSGYSNDPVIINFRAYGFIGALPKPYTKKELNDMLIRL